MTQTFDQLLEEIKSNVEAMEVFCMRLANSYNMIGRPTDNDVVKTQRGKLLSDSNKLSMVITDKIRQLTRLEMNEEQEGKRRKLFKKFLGVHDRIQSVRQKIANKSAPLEQSKKSSLAKTHTLLALVLFLLFIAIASYCIYMSHPTKIHDEGLTIFTKGLLPRLISNSFYSCIVMVGYEAVKCCCVLPEYKHAVKW